MLGWLGLNSLILWLYRSFVLWMMICLFHRYVGRSFLEALEFGFDWCHGISWSFSELLWLKFKWNSQIVFSILSVHRAVLVISEQSPPYCTLVVHIWPHMITGQGVDNWGLVLKPPSLRHMKHCKGSCKRLSKLITNAFLCHKWGCWRTEPKPCRKSHSFVPPSFHACRLLASCDDFPLLYLYLFV